MRDLTLVLLLSGAVHESNAQNIYFPPNVGNTWETVDPASMGWCTDQIPPLFQFLEDNNTKAFIVLKDGRIAIEHYFGTFTQDSVWYWASAGKSLTAFLVGKAQEEGFLDINEPSSDYLGPGWTSCTPTQEAAITIRHQLSMTTGLDDGFGDVDCTDPACLHYLADPGTRWAYHNAPYTELDGVISGATGVPLNSYVFQKLTLTTGLTGLYVSVGYNNVFFSTPRSMARYGLLALNRGNWNGTQLLNTAYFDAMTTPSQSLNNSYGYLWWLNGQADFMLPGLQLTLPGPLVPNEPLDAFNALGKNGQFINVAPGQGIVLIRMGNAPDPSLPVPYLLNDAIWEHMNGILCLTTDVSQTHMTGSGLSISPNPGAGFITLGIDPALGTGMITLTDMMGGTVHKAPSASTGMRMDISGLAPGMYTATMQGSKGRASVRFLKE